MNLFETILVVFCVLIWGDVVDWSGWWIVLWFFLAWAENILISLSKKSGK